MPHGRDQWLGKFLTSVQGWGWSGLGGAINAKKIQNTLQLKDIQSYNALKTFKELAEFCRVEGNLKHVKRITLKLRCHTQEIFLGVEDNWSICIFQVFVVGSHTSALWFLSLIVHPLFELFCFTRKGVSHLRWVKSSCFPGKMEESTG